MLAPLVGSGLGELFATERINFIDLAGNCYVRIGEQFLAHVQGQRSSLRKPTDRSLRAPAFSVLFALLANPELAHATTRTLAEAAGSVSPQTAADLRAKLIANGTLIKTKAGIRWAPNGRKQALDMFLFAFPHLIPGFMIGRFRAKQKDPTQLEADLAPRLTLLGEWRWGGGAAAQRLTGYYRGDRTVVYLRDRKPAGVQRLPLIPDPDGNVVLMGGFVPLALQGPTSDVVHPLLVYADLLHEGHDRAREAADQLFQRYLATPESAP